MASAQAEQETRKKRWGWYFAIGIGILLTALVTVALVFFWREMWNIGSIGILGRRYGYLIGFMVSVMGGITVIPVPSLLVVFSLGHIVNPLFLGFLSGLGEALGGITVYLTGAGGGVIWSKLRSKRQDSYAETSQASAKPKPHARWLTLYYRMVSWIQRRGCTWFVFITSAFVWGLYYPAGLAAGTLHIGLMRFFLISWIGKTIRGMIVAFGGYWGLRFVLQWIGA